MFDPYYIVKCIIQCSYNNQQIQLMSQQLPEYKLNFIKQMEQMRQKKLQEQEAARIESSQPEKEFKEVQKATNVLYNDNQYTGSNWRADLTQTFYRRQHNQTHFHLNTLLNPEVARKKHNVRVTQISEYSNAKHNNTVFVNPKNTSC